MDIENSLADDILNIPYIDSDNMDEYLKNLADRARKLEIKRILNMQYGVPQDPFNLEEHKEWLQSIRPWGYDDKFEVNAVIKLVQPKSSINQIITEVKEDVDNFIFETIKPWCEERIQRKICKADLEQALLMFYSLDKVDPESTVFNKETK